MMPKVAVVDKSSFMKAVDLIGGVDDLNTAQRKVVVKVGIYNVKTGICTTADTLSSMISPFDNATKVLVAESDSNAGPGLERLRIWENCYDDRVTPFNLSHDGDTTDVEIAGEMVPFSHVFNPELISFRWLLPIIMSFTGRRGDTVSVGLITGSISFPF